MKKVLIIDDETAGRKMISQYIAEYKEFIIVGEANNGVDAVRLINEFKPDLIFLDIQMPGMTGFDVLTHIEEIPQIIFSTAYDKYALEAFEVHAVDYLLKPYTRERFKKAIERIRNSDNVAGVKPLTESLLMDRPSYPERILVQTAKKLITIAVNEIIRIEADGDYSSLIIESGKFLSNYGISKLEQRLDSEVFIRVHRSSIINLNYIREVNKYVSSYDVVMQNGDIVRVSRGYMDNLKKLMF
jgi:two-component system LytT family response regulator